MYAIPMRVAGDLRATRLMQSDSGACRVFLPPVPSLCVSAYVCCTVCVCVPQVAVSGHAVLCAVLFNSVVIAVGCLRLSVSMVEER
jgi:predicted lysophospholipase L1 biosynthesis ABC-type transport system permease subunit